MNLFANVERRHIGTGMLKVWLLVICLLAAPAWSAQTAPGKRFLFVVDASASMKPLEKPLRETLFDLIYSGARGHMTNGDTYGVWVVSEQNDTSFPMEVWKEKFAVEIAAKAVSHVKNHGFRGKPNFLRAMVDVTRVVKNIGDLTIIFISNGDTLLIGTPFDESINARVRELAPTMKAAKITVNTTVVAQDGKFVAWAVNSPQFLIDIPYVAPKLKPVAVEPPVTAPVAVAKSTKPVTAPSRVASNPIIITKETVAEERRSYVASWTNTNAPTAAPLALVATNVESNSLTLATTNELAAVITNQTNAVVAKSPVPVNPITNVAPATTIVASVTAEVPPTKVVVAPAELPPAAPAAVSNRNWSFILLCVAAGAGGAFFVLISVLLINRARRREPSLISQAIARERMQAR